MPSALSCRSRSLDGEWCEREAALWHIIRAWMQDTIMKGHLRRQLITLDEEVLIVISCKQGSFHSCHQSSRWGLLRGCAIKQCCILGSVGWKSLNITAVGAIENPQLVGYYQWKGQFFNCPSACGWRWIAVSTTTSHCLLVKATIHELLGVVEHTSQQIWCNMWDEINHIL